MYAFRSATFTRNPHPVTGTETLRNGAQGAFGPQAQIWDGQQQGRASEPHAVEDEGVVDTYAGGSGFAGAWLTCSHSLLVCARL